MSIKSAPYYWLECDTCGERAEYGEFTALGTDGDAIDAALDSEWTTDGEKYNCPKCPIITHCERCNKPAGDEAGERDYLCETCWAEVETAS